jgi:hypothetical protein
MSLALKSFLSAVLLGLHAPIFAACTPEGPPMMALSVSAAQVSVADRILSIRVYDNGCVALHRPAFYRAAGNYRLAITGAEQAQLRQTITPERLRQIDMTELRLAGRARSSGGRLQRFEVVDADLYVLEVGSDAGMVKLAHAGLLAEAEALPENADLQSLRVMVQALLVLELRADAVKVSAP